MLCFILLAFSLILMIIIIIIFTYCVTIRSYTCGHLQITHIFNCLLFGNLFFFFFFFLSSFCYRAHALARKTERDREIESEKSPPRGDGHAAIPSPPFSSRDHVCTRAQCEFKPPGPGLELRLTSWEFSNIAIMLLLVPILCYLKIS